MTRSTNLEEYSIIMDSRPDDFVVVPGGRSDAEDADEPSASETASEGEAW
ncbi:hypothetical protein [Halomicrococcus sp. NG-SE-24]